MLKNILFISCILFSMLSYSAVYKSVDSRGIVTYSDNPDGNAFEVKLSTLPKVTNQKTLLPEDHKNKKNTLNNDVHDFSYSIFSIVSPKMDEYVRNNEGNLDVEVNIEPAMQYNHVIQVFLDDNKLPMIEKTHRFTINNVDRGEHSIALMLIDDKGKVLMRTEKIKFFMHRQLNVSHVKKQ